MHNAHALYAAAGEPKELWLLPEIEHAGAIESDCAAYRERVAGFFRRWLLNAVPPAEAAGRASEAGARDTRAV